MDWDFILQAKFVITSRFEEQQSVCFLVLYSGAVDDVEYIFQQFKSL